MLHNETYVGRWYYRKTKAVKNLKTGKKKRVKRDKSEWLLVEVPAILSETIFQAAGKFLDSNKRRMGKRRKHLYAIRGMLQCGHCSNGISGITHGKYPYYICNAKHSSKRYGIKCDNANYNVKQVDTTVWQWVKSILLSPEKLTQSLRNHREQQRAALQPFMDMIRVNETKLTELHEEKER